MPGVCSSGIGNHIVRLAISSVVSKSMRTDSLLGDGLTVTLAGTMLLTWLRFLCNQRHIGDCRQVRHRLALGPRQSSFRCIRTQNVGPDIVCRLVLEN